MAAPTGTAIRPRPPSPTGGRAPGHDRPADPPAPDGREGRDDHRRTRRRVVAGLLAVAALAGLVAASGNSDARPTPDEVPLEHPGVEPDAPMQVP